MWAELEQLVMKADHNIAGADEDWFKLAKGKFEHYEEVIEGKKKAKEEDADLVAIDSRGRRRAKTLNKPAYEAAGGESADAERYRVLCEHHRAIFPASYLDCTLIPALRGVFLVLDFHKLSVIYAK